MTMTKAGSASLQKLKNNVISGELRLPAAFFAQNARIYAKNAVVTEKY